MNNITVNKVSAERYQKIIKDKATDKAKRQAAEAIKRTAFYLTVSASFYLAVFFLCFAICSFKPLWYDTLLKPPFIPPPAVFVAINALFACLLCYIMFKMFARKDKAGIIGLFINGFFYALIAYMFFGLKSPLGSFITLLAVFVHTGLLASNYKRNNKFYLAAFSLFAAWQLFVMFIVYAILMLN